MGKIISLVRDNSKQVLWIVHRRNLVMQMKDTLESHFDITPGVIMSGIDHDLERNVQLCTLQTYSRRMNLGYFGENKFYMDPDIIIIDECHRSVSKTYKELLDRYNGKIIIGTTATPMRADGRGMGEVYDAIVEVASLKDLTDQGYLAPARYFAPVNVDLTGVKVERGDYVIKDLDGKLNRTKLIGDIVENWLRIAEDRQTIVFCVNVKHSKAVCEEFNKQGIPAEHLDARSPDKERDRVFKRMEDGEIKVVTNVALYQEGLDVPDASCCVLARPTESLGLYRQMCGRILRPSDKWLDALILDHGNCIETHGLLDWPITWTLDGKKKAYSKPSRKQTEKLVICKVCHKVFSGSNKCPDCGSPVRSYGKKIATIEADLEEITGKEKFSMAEKRRWFGMFLYRCKDKGYKREWAYHKYEEKFKEKPKGMNKVEPIEPDQEFNNWIKHLNIKYAKWKAKQEAQEQLHRGGELAKQYEAGLHAN